jgi:hypothetical protein
MADDRVSGGVRITREMVVAKVRALFPPADWDAVLAVLDEAVLEPPGWRVQMAILRLADGSVDALLAWALEARTDWRDVLVAGEYPREGRAWEVGFGTLPEAERDRIRLEDRDEYLRWLGVEPGAEPA